jgi:hypothetical protein
VGLQRAHGGDRERGVSAATRSVHCAFVDRALVAADLEAWRRARGGGAEWPLVLISMGADDGDVERFGRECASAVLAPPFQLRTLRAAVRAVSKECV